MTSNFWGAYQVGRLFLFAFRIRENGEDKDTELNQVRPCNAHICYSLSLSIGRKIACRGADSTVDGFDKSQT